MGLKGYNIGEGEIVEVQGGHILRATARKDRHSKVFTSKGPRDRRVRLSALTAIQFYDVQDRLGYDRPSKAVDWLIMKAKSAIDKLEETSIVQEPEDNNKPESSSLNHNQMVEDLDHEEVMKRFLPVTSCSNMNFQNYPYHGHDDDDVSRTTKLSQDLGLSLHTLQENKTSPFETFGRISGWNHYDLAMPSSEQQQERISNGGFMVNHYHNQPSMMMTLLNSQQQQQQVFLGSQQQQRGTLQSSLLPHSFRSWDHHQTTSYHHNHNIQGSSVMLASSSQFGTHGMMMMQGLSFPEEATQPSTSSSPTPNSHH